MSDIKSIATEIFKGLPVSIDDETLALQVRKYNVSDGDLEEILKIIANNIDFFQSRLKFTLQVSNLFLYAMDALYEPEHKWRGGLYRPGTTKEFQSILQKHLKK